MALGRVILATILFVLLAWKPSPAQISVSSQSFDYITGPIQIGAGEGIDVFVLNNGPTTQNARIVIFNVPFIQPMSQVQVLDSDVQPVVSNGFAGRAYAVATNGIYNIRINIDSRALVPVVSVRSSNSVPRLNLTGGMMTFFIRGIVQY